MSTYHLPDTVILFCPHTVLQGRHCYPHLAGKEAETLGSGLRAHSTCSEVSWPSIEGLADSDILSLSLSP